MKKQQQQQQKEQHNSDAVAELIDLLSKH